MKFILFLKKKAVYIPLSVLIIIVAGVVIYKAINKPVYQTVSTERREFVQELSATGKVVAANDVTLGFENGGRVTAILTTVGSKVFKGKALAYVNNTDLYASLLDQQARLTTARIALTEVERGIRPTELNNIKNSFQQAEIDLETTIGDSFVNSDDVLRSNIDIMFTNPTGPYPRIADFNNNFKQHRIEDQRVEIGKMLNAWKKSIDKLGIEGYNDSYRIEAETNLKTMRAILDDIGVASSYFENSSEITATERQRYTAAISTGRTTINLAISSLNASYQSYINMKGTLDLSVEGSTTEEIQRAQTAVQSAQANVLQAQAALARTSIIAPFDGIVTKIDLRVGAQVSSGAPVVGMISNANFEIESFIPEADIAKVKVGDTGTTTLDAYGDTDPFVVVVTGIDLSETEVDGVSTYKTTLQFSTSDDRIRSGMTANIDLVSETRYGILSIPQSSIINTSGKRTVLVMNTNGKIKSREIKTGSLDNSGHIEVKSGLEEGENIVTNPVK